MKQLQTELWLLFVCWRVKTQPKLSSQNCLMLWDNTQLFLWCTFFLTIEHVTWTLLHYRSSELDLQSARAPWLPLKIDLRRQERLVFEGQTWNLGQQKNRGNSAALGIHTMPATHETQHSTQQHDHMKHQEKQGLHHDDGLEALLTCALEWCACRKHTVQ